MYITKIAYINLYFNFKELKLKTNTNDEKFVIKTFTMLLNITSNYFDRFHLSGFVFIMPGHREQMIDNVKQFNNFCICLRQFMIISYIVRS